jgi:tetratricopeptide (TPR) repeat protein
MFASAKGIRNYVGDIGQARRRVDLARPMVLLGLDHARRGLELEPESAVGWRVLGQLELSRDGPPPNESSPRYRLPFDPVFDLSSARGTYALRRSLEASPDDFSALLSLEFAFKLRAMHEAALPLLDRMARLRPINLLQRKTQADIEPRRAELRAALGGDPPTSWENQSELDQAVTAMLAAGRAGSAAALLERAYPAETRPWEVSDRLGTLWLHLGEPSRARSVWEAALDPPRPALRKARVALTYLVEGSFDAARQAFREAMSGDPTLFEAAYGLAVLEADAGRAAESLAAARTALALAPNDIARSASRTLVDLTAPYAGAIPTTEQGQDGGSNRTANVN